MEPSKIVTTSYNKQAFESLPRCIQRHVGTKEKWEEMQQECEERGRAQEETGEEDSPNSRASNLRFMGLERRARDALPRYKDSKDALEAMKQYLKSKPPLPTAVSDESMKDRRARLRKHWEMRDMRNMAMWVLAGNEVSAQESEMADAREVLAGVETALAHNDAESGHQDEDVKVIEAVSKGNKVPGVVGGPTHVRGAKAYKEEGWVIIPTGIVESKCQDDVPSQIESESEYDEEFGEENHEEDDSEEEALWSIAGPVPSR